MTLPESRLEKIQQLQPPSDFKVLQSVAGTLNFLRHFVPRYSDVAAPIISLLKSPDNFVWGEEQQKAFDLLKTILLKNLLPPGLSYIRVL